MAKTDGENHGKSAPVTDPLITNLPITDRLKPGAPSGPPTAEASGCPTSFLTQKNNEMGGAVCGAVPANPQEEYVQKDEEKEVGGEA
jgi:hypothetical protein